MHIIIGISKDKDINGILSILPKDAIYYFTQASSQRAASAETLMQKGKEYGLNGKMYKNVKEAVNNALKNASENDFIYISGSTFIVAEALLLFPESIK